MARLAIILVLKSFNNLCFVTCVSNKFDNILVKTQRESVLIKSSQHTIYFLRDKFIVTFESQVSK